MKLFILKIILITVSFSVFGQSKSEFSNSMLDSLKQELKFVNDDTLKILIMLQIADSYRNMNPDTAIYYSQEALQLAKQLKDIPAQMGAMAFKGQALIRKGNLPKALELGIDAIDMGKNLPVRIAGGVGPNYGNLGELYMQIGDYDKALQYFNKMTAMGEGDLVGVAYGYYFIALVYEKLNQLDSANIYLEKSYQTFGELNYTYYPKVYDVYPPWYNLRAKIYLKQNKPRLALNDLFTTLKMTLRSGDISLTSNTYIDISNYYEKLNKIDSVVYYAEKAFNEANKISDTQGILDASEILAKQYETKDPVKALYFLKLAIETRNNFYGAGNIQIMRDMIAQEEKRQTEIKETKTAYQNRLKMNAILGTTFTLFVIAIFLFIIYRRKQKAKQKIESAFNQLKSTQSQLIQSEKMASLGELTAGIAHEIQNPLNFVNNFSELSNELIEEMKEELAIGNMQSAEELANDIKENEQKINHHGKRADAIVKGMLQHSRTSNGVKEPTDINALADEYLRLSYHGLRAKDKSFNADFKTDFDPTLPKISVIPQDIGRVLLNLINNAFYAVQVETQHAASLQQSPQKQPDYKPMVMVSTKNMETHVEICVKDNGPGIPAEIKDKIFQPFFTTKPTGQGTGLGLSLAYDSVKAHDGEITLESKENGGTEFIIHLKIS
jgi:two-component system, NtrC family, sensor kinase